MPVIRRKVTMEDIARETGFTVNTVSRALRNKPDISQATCELIQQKAREMGYVHNYIASSLREGRTKTIAVVTGGLFNSFYAVLVELLSQEASRQGYSMMILCSEDDPEKETRAVEMALGRQVDGVLLIPCAEDSPALTMLRASGKPFVLLSRPLSSGQDDCVYCDDERGGYLAGRYLIRQGHREMAYLTAGQVCYSTQARFEGMRRACLEADMPEDSIRYAEIREEAAALARMESWIREGVTGIFSFCDMEAWKNIALLERHGYSVPRDAEFVGFDNIQEYLQYPRPIPTIDGSLREEAASAIRMLRARIHNSALPPQRMILPVALVVR